MKRSKAVMLTLAGVSLGVTGCRREAEPVNVHSTPVLPPEALSPAMRASLPAFVPGQDVSRQIPPHNAYDPQLGYYHQPCSGWFPYPYDHYDSRWGYYRCGRWSRYHSTRVYPSSSTWHRTGPVGYGGTVAAGLSDGTSNSPTTSAGANGKPGTAAAPSGDYSTQPAGAPVHTGVPHTQATTTRSAFTSRGGFGSTGRSFGFFSGS